MARAKNRGYQQSFSPSYTIRRWRLGIYIRLSKEDLKNMKKTFLFFHFPHLEMMKKCRGL